MKTLVYANKYGEAFQLFGLLDIRHFRAVLAQNQKAKVKVYN